jgi:hypothetical protein
MTSEMAFECLLVSADPSVTRTVSPMLRDLSITTNLCQDPASIVFHMNERSTDLFVVDVDGPHGDEAIREIRGLSGITNPPSSPSQPRAKKFQQLTCTCGNQSPGIPVFSP